MNDPDFALVLCRSLIFTKGLMIWGATAFRWRLQPGAEQMGFEGWLVIAMVVATAVLLPIQVARIAGGWSEVGDPTLIRDVIAFTSPGQAWALQALAAIATAFAFAMRWTRTVVAATTLVFVAQSMSGHAAASEGGIGLLRQANDVLHMVAAGAWLGALPYVLRLLVHLERAETRAVLIRYSGEGHFWVALVLLTGMTSTLWIFETIPLDWSVRYQFLWAIKVCATVAMVGLALRNRYVLVPRLRTKQNALGALARATKGEILLGLLAVTLVGWFGTLEPK